MNRFIIYTLKDPITNEIRYVGFTSQRYLSSRLAQHVLQAKKGKSNLYLHNWIRKLLKSKCYPVIEYLDETSDNWQDLEKYWILQFKTWGFNLTNLSEGGEGNPGIKFTYEQVRKKFKPVLQYDLEGNFIKEFESLKSVEKEGFGKSNVKDACKKFGLSGLYQWRYKENVIELKIEKSKNKRLDSPILQYSLDNIFIKEWKSPIEVSKILNIEKSNIIACCRGKRNKAGNYIWKYKIK